MDAKTIVNIDKIVADLRNEIRKLKSKVTLDKLESYADDTAAKASGLKAGDFYIVSSTFLVKQIE